jgi:hypothetical protein
MLKPKSGNQTISYLNEYGRKPANLSELIELAMEEHLKYHSTDGLSLFILNVYAAGGKWYTHPISAMTLDDAVRIIANVHASWGLPEPLSAELLFSTSAAHQGSIQ